jgi:hypothetical protein
MCAWRDHPERRPEDTEALNLIATASRCDAGSERQRVGMASRRTLTADERSEVRAMETMIGIGVLLAGIGVFWVCFALGVYYFTRTGREGMRLQQMEAERRKQQSPGGSGAD